MCLYARRGGLQRGVGRERRDFAQSEHGCPSPSGRFSSRNHFLLGHWPLLVWRWLLLLPVLSDLSLFQCHAFSAGRYRLTIYSLNTCSVRKGVPPVPASQLAGTVLWPVLDRECVWWQVFSEVFFCVGSLVLFFLLRIERLQRKTPNLLLSSSGKVLWKAGNSQHPQYNHPLARRLVSPTSVWKAQGTFHPHAAKKCTVPRRKQ